MTAEGPTIRPLDPGASGEISLVAGRMRDTLVEVLGGERGASMYSLEWLVRRVRWHLDPDQVVGEVFVAEDRQGRIVGHTMVRVAEDEPGRPLGLFSTTYVVPSARHRRVATRLLERGEGWMIAYGLTEARTYTDVDNAKLQALYTERGYTLTPMPEVFVQLAKALPASI